MDLVQHHSEGTSGVNNVRIDENLSCPVKPLKNYVYVILFNWKEDLKKPFKMFPRKAFTQDEIRDDIIAKQLPNLFRLKKLKPLKPLPGQRMSLFAKVEASE